MLTSGALTLAVFVVSIVLVAGLVLHPEVTAARVGKILAFVALFVLPIIAAGLGLTDHFEKSKQTTFCLSCHVMEPYGKSLHVDDKHYVAAAENIHLYNAYNNRECLHCHLGARSFEDEPTHSAMRDDLVSNQTSCMTSGCHDTVHNVKDLASQKFWKEVR